MIPKKKNQKKTKLKIFDAQSAQDEISDEIFELEFMLESLYGYDKNGYKMKEGIQEIQEKICILKDTKKMWIRRN